MIVNENEHMIYGTSTERRADTFFCTKISNKWYDTSYGKTFESNGTRWREIEEGDPNAGGKNKTGKHKCGKCN